MKHFLVILAFLATSTLSFSQSFDNQPIYKHFTQTLKIQERDNGSIYFSFQDPDYQVLTEFTGFRMNSKQEALDLMNACMNMFNTQMKGIDNHLRHEIHGIQMVRYGFSRGAVNIGPDYDLNLTKKQVQKIIASLQSYNYSSPLNS